MSSYIECRYLADAADITDIEPLRSDGKDEYLIRVVFKEGDRQWGQWMVAKTSELVEYLFK